MDLTRVKCDNCGNDGGDNCLVLIKDVVGQILIGMRPDGSLVGDGEPLYFDVVAEQDRQVAWCSACGETTTLITIEEDEDEDLPD
jgi:hypothetical protein